MSLKTFEIEGDDTGRVTVRRTQAYTEELDRVLQTVAVLSQRDSNVHLPPSLDCRGIDMYIKGNTDDCYEFVSYWMDILAFCGLVDLVHFMVTEIDTFLEYDSANTPFEVILLWVILL